MKQQSHAGHDHFELEEADIFDREESGSQRAESCHGSDGHHEPSDDQHAPGDLSEDEDMFRQDLDVHMPSSTMDMARANSGSVKSTTLNVVLESEAEGVLLEDDATGLVVQRQTVAWAASVRPRTSRMQPFMAQSMPANSSNVKMGSSVPINIPFMARVAAKDNQQSPIAPALATFVPPHQLSQKNDYTLAMMGESPGGVLKRDRLRMRNSILKSTGFLEGNSLLPGMVAGVGTVSGGDLHVGITPVKGGLGGLSQALQLSSSPALH